MHPGVQNWRDYNMGGQFAKETPPAVDRSPAPRLHASLDRYVGGQAAGLDRIRPGHRERLPPARYEV